MIRPVLLLLLIGAALNTRAQLHTPVTWQFSVVPAGGSEAQLIFTASLEEGWHIYSQFIGEGGPLPTTFTFTASDHYTPIGKVEELSSPVKGYDKTFMMDIVWYSKTVVFIQKVSLHAPVTTINGKVEFMVCRDEMCLPPNDVAFAFEVKGG